MEISSEFIVNWLIQNIDIFLQTLGVVIVLLSQVHFIWKGYRKWGSLKKFLLDLTCPRLGHGKEKLKKLSKEELNKEFRKFYLANWLYDDIIYSMIGLALTFLGLLISLIKGSI